MRKHLSTMGNTIVPAIATLEQLGFVVSIREENAPCSCYAVRGDESYSADSPETLLGLIKLVSTP